MLIQTGFIPETYIKLILHHLIGLFYIKFSRLWKSISLCMSVVVGKYMKLVWPIIEDYLLKTRDEYDSMEQLDEISNIMSTSVINSNRKRHEPIFDVYINSIYLYLY